MEKKVPINKVFKDYAKVSAFMQANYGMNREDLAGIGDSLVYESPQVNDFLLIKKARSL